MAVVLVAAAAAQNAGVTTPAATAAITPTLPTGTAVTTPAMRVYVFQSHSCETGSAATPTDWTAVYKDVVVGTGTASAAAGRRFISCYYRDYDSAWSMPSFALASATQNSHAIAALTLACDPTETFATPTFSGDGEYFGTAGTAFSAATPAAFNAIAKAFLMAHSVTNDNVTATSGAITGSGFVSGTVTERADGGTATGNDVTIKLHTCSPTTGANVALTHTMTLSAASQGGWAAVQQTATYGGSTPADAWLYDNFRDPDGTLLTAHTPEQGTTWAGQTGWPGAGTIQRNRAYTSGGAPLAQVTPPSANYEVTASVTIVSKVAGEQFFVMGRAPESGGTGYTALLYTSDGVNYTLYCRYLSGFSVAADMGNTGVGNLVLGSTHTVSVRMDGNQISATFDATTIGPFTNSGLTAVGKAGFAEWGNQATATTGIHVESITAAPYPPVTAMEGSASGSYTWAGSAAGTRTPKGSASGAYTWAGSAAGKRTPKASASGAYTFAGAASGKRTPKASSSGTYTWAGSATGDTPANRGTAAGSYTFVGAAAGSRVSRGAASGAYAWTGTAAGGRASRGTVAGTYMWAGSAVGEAPALDTQSGTAAGSYTFAGSATGSRTPNGSATGAYTFAGTATGVTPPVLLGEWGFLNNLNDTSGSGHTGTFTAGSGGSLTYVAGPQTDTKGIQFSHAQDFVSFGRTGLEATADGTTIMGWIKSSTTGADLLGLLSKARASASSRSRIGTSKSRNPAYVARWKNDLRNSDAVTPALDTGWHHIALVDGNTVWALYIDGVLHASHNGTRALDNSSGTTWEAFDWVTGYNGAIGDNYADPSMAVSGIRIFQGELTGTEVTDWMNTPIAADIQEGTASGAYTFAGAAAGVRASSGSASGTYGWVGAASGEIDTTGTAAGSYTFSGAAAGETSTAGTASGTYTWAGSAAGNRAATAAVSGTYTWTGTAAGEAPALGVNDGSANGFYSFTGTADGESNPQASASGGYTFTGSAIGQTPAEDVQSGSVVAAYTFTGGATGTRNSSGATSGNYGWDGAAIGWRISEGTTAGSYTFTGTAEGEAPTLAIPEGTASGSYGWTGLALSGGVRVGTAEGSYGWTGRGWGWLTHFSAERMLTVEAENRLLTVQPEDRLLTVEAEDRTLLVPAEDRTLVVAAEDRTITVATEERGLTVGIP